MKKILKSIHFDFLQGGTKGKFWNVPVLWGKSGNTSNRGSFGYFWNVPAIDLKNGHRPFCTENESKIVTIEIIST